MATENVEDVLRHYREDGAAEAAERLGRLGATAEQLRGVLDDPEVAALALRVVDLAAGAPQLAVPELLRLSVLAEERATALRQQVVAATQVRYAAIRIAADQTSIVDIARQLGITRQAVSQIVKSPTNQNIRPDALTRLRNKLGGVS